MFIIQSFVAQLPGRGERDQAPRFAWYGLAIALAAAIIAMALVPWIGPALALTDYSPSASVMPAFGLAPAGAILAGEAIGRKLV